mgnify:FL=1
MTKHIQPSKGTENPFSDDYFKALIRKHNVYCSARFPSHADQGDVS